MIDAAQLRHVARLARVDLAGMDVERLRAELGRVLDLVAVLERADVGDAQDAPATMALRPDLERPCLPVEALLAGAPQVSEDGAFVVPKVLP